MISITPSAIEAVKEIQVKENNAQLGLRLAVAGGGCAGFSYKLDLEQNQKEGDLVLEKEGVRFFIDPKSLKLLDGLELDYFRTMSQRGFRFNNPNAKTTCGCGTSFSLQ